MLHVREAFGFAPASAAVSCTEYVVERARSGRGGDEEDHQMSPNPFAKPALMPGFRKLGSTFSLSTNLILDSQHRHSSSDLSGTSSTRSFDPFAQSRIPQMISGNA